MRFQVVFSYLGGLASWISDHAVPNLAMTSQTYLFGGSEPWFSSSVSWTAVDDRVRGGSSQSYLDTVENSTHVRFSGTLDTRTLGGAGFASQSTRRDKAWDLSDYDGIQLEVVKADIKTYTFIVKDEVPNGKRDDGREKSSINWEYDFKLTSEASSGPSNKSITIPWNQFKATYRGRERKDATPLKTSQIQRFSLMMRSFFEEQEGDFELTLDSISAVKL